MTKFFGHKTLKMLYLQSILAIMKIALILLDI